MFPLLAVRLAASARVSLHSRYALFGALIQGSRPSRSKSRSGCTQMIDRCLQFCCSAFSTRNDSHQMAADRIGSTARQAMNVTPFGWQPIGATPSETNQSDSVASPWHCRLWTHQQTRNVVLSLGQTVTTGQMTPVTSTFSVTWHTHAVL